MQIRNKSAGFYKIIEKLEAGIVLFGSEVKALKSGHADLSASYVKIIGMEAFVVNAKIYPYQAGRKEGYDESRSRKLLIHKKEILALKTRISQGNFTIIPLSFYTKNNLIKLQVALVQGKKKYEKKEDLKQKDLEREAEIELKNYR